MYRYHPLGNEAEISATSLVLNVLWLIFGGALAALGWFVAALIMAITIIGLPWARAAVDNGIYTLWPFGVRAIERTHVDAEPAGPLTLAGNLIWFVLAGWWLALGHVVTAVGLAITLIGLPFAWAHVKLAGFSLWPLGRTLTAHNAPLRRTGPYARQHYSARSYRY